MIFTSPIFEALAGSCTYDTANTSTTGNVEVVEATTYALTAEEEALYRPIWDRLVDKKRVAAKFGTKKNSTTPSQIKVALTEFRKINALVRFFCHCSLHENWSISADFFICSDQVSAFAARHDVVYYLAAAHRAPTTGWTKIGTNRVKFAEWLHDKYRVDLIFGLFAQGQSLVKAIDAVRPGVAARQRKSRSAADIMKGKLTAALNRLLGKSSYHHYFALFCCLLTFQIFVVCFLERALGAKRPQGFPKGKDPAAILIAKQIPVRMWFGPCARAEAEDVAVGYNKMEHRVREDWFHDIRDKRFKLLRTDGVVVEGQDEDEETDEEEEEEEFVEQDEEDDEEEEVGEDDDE